MLEPTDQADERYPGVINVPIQITLDPVTTILQNDIDVFISIAGGNATGKGHHYNTFYFLYICSWKAIAIFHASNH